MLPVTRSVSFCSTTSEYFAFRLRRSDCLHNPWSGDKDVAGPLSLSVGGLAFEGLPDLWSRLGADAYGPDAKAALRAAADLVGEPR